MPPKWPPPNWRRPHDGATARPGARSAGDLGSGPVRLGLMMFAAAGLSVGLAKLLT